MKLFKAIGLTLVAVFAIAAISSATAFALPALLNSEKKEVKTKVTSNEEKVTELQTLGAGTKVECKSQKSESEITGETGPFHIEFKGCTAKIGGITAGTCTGTGDASGVILTLGKADLVFDSLTTLGVAVLFLLEPATAFSCKSIITVNESVTGDVLCLISPINTLSTSSTLKCEQSSGDPKETTYWNAKGEPVKAELLTSENGGTPVDSAEGGEVKLANSPSAEIMG